MENQRKSLHLENKQIRWIIIIMQRWNDERAKRIAWQIIINTIAAEKLLWNREIKARQ